MEPSSSPGTKVVPLRKTDSRTAPSPVAKPPANTIVQKRLQRLLSLVPAVVSGGDAEAVHDFRVWSRRLQQAIEALYPKPRPRRVRSVRRTLRRARRVLGEWRNCDVVLDLVRRRQRRSRSGPRRRAWALVEGELQKRRAQEAAKACEKLLRLGLHGPPAVIEKVLDRDPPTSGTLSTRESLLPAIRSAWSELESALEQARHSRDARDLHAFRIAAKRLRYRIEPARDLGETDFRDALRWLKDLQDALGAWHDRQVLYQMTAEALARPEILLNEAEAARLVLADLEKERRADLGAMEEIFRLATEHSGRTRFTERLAR